VDPLGDSLADVLAVGEQLDVAGCHNPTRAGGLPPGWTPGRQHRPPDSLARYKRLAETGYDPPGWRTPVRRARRRLGSSPPHPCPARAEVRLSGAVWPGVP
jgi:hypothetical protein